MPKFVKNNSKKRFEWEELLTTCSSIESSLEQIFDALVYRSSRFIYLFIFNRSPCARMSSISTRFVRKTSFYSRTIRNHGRLMSSRSLCWSIAKRERQDNSIQFKRSSTQTNWCLAFRSLEAFWHDEELFQTGFDQLKRSFRDCNSLSANARFNADFVYETNQSTLVLCKKLTEENSIRNRRRSLIIEQNEQTNQRRTQIIHSCFFIHPCFGDMMHQFVKRWRQLRSINPCLANQYAHAETRQLASFLVRWHCNSDCQYSNSTLLRDRWLVSGHPLIAIGKISRSVRQWRYYFWTR